MSFWSRVANVFRGDRITREIDEELESHIQEAIDQGRDPDDARRAFGSVLRSREDSRDVKLAPWLESLSADVTFGFRQLRKNRVASGAAILSLALAIGACSSAFRLIDAILLRPLPVADPQGLYVLTIGGTAPDGSPITSDTFEYPAFRVLRAAVAGQAELAALSYFSRNGITYGGPTDIERVYKQFVSGWTFEMLGLKPAVGRLFTTADDLKPGAHPYAVLSYDYWTRRFGRDPKVIGKVFRMGKPYEIIGVIQPGFTGTETGAFTDFYLPTMMNDRAINAANWGWFRIWARPKPGVDTRQLQQKLQATLNGYRQERVKAWPTGTSSEKQRAEYVQAPLSLENAAAGYSGLQKDYRRSLAILGVVVLLVLLIACANVANLMTAQAAARAREMALRVSIGAGRARLVQMVMVEGGLIALAASLLGGVFAWWSAPLVVRLINDGENPVQLVLPADWRVLGFSAVLALVVTLAFGLIPALRASAVKPMSALRGGEDPHSRRRLMNALVAAQVAFCFLVHFFCGLFVSTFERMSNQPTGFVAEHVLTLETSTKEGQAAVYWELVGERLKAVGGVQSVGISSWALMSGNAASYGIWVNGQSPEDAPYALDVSPGWLEAMKITLIGGRDFRATDQRPNTAIVNEAFAKRFFNGLDPTGKSFETEDRTAKGSKRATVEIVGYVRNARYQDLREPLKPTFYTPFRSDKEDPPDWATYVVRTAGDPAAMIPTLSQAVAQARSGFRVASARTQTELVQQHAIRERLLATLSLFFAVVALLLAAVGLYGVLNYSVLQRRREIGIRMALGARAGDVARRVTSDVFAMLALGAVSGLAIGAGSERYLGKLLYEVKTTDLPVLAIPAVIIFVTALLAALPPVIRAVRIDPSTMLRSE